MKNKAYHSTARDDYVSPPQIIERVRAVGPIALDPCAGNVATHGVINIRWGRHCTETGGYGDGLTHDWARAVEIGGGGLVYSNSPYGGRGRVIDRWVEKYIAEAEHGVEIIGLVPASTGSWWWRQIFATAAAGCAWAGRMKFIDPATGEFVKHLNKKTGKMVEASAPFWSWLILWSPLVHTANRFIDAFEDVGDLYLFNRPDSPYAVSARAASGVARWARDRRKQSPLVSATEPAPVSQSPLASAGLCLSLAIAASRWTSPRTAVNRQRLAALRAYFARQGIDVTDDSAKTVHDALAFAESIIGRSELGANRA